MRLRSAYAALSLIACACAAGSQEPLPTAPNVGGGAGNTSGGHAGGAAGGAGGSAGSAGVAMTAGGSTAGSAGAPMTAGAGGSVAGSAGTGGTATDGGAGQGGTSAGAAGESGGGTSAGAGGEGGGAGGATTAGAAGIGTSAGASGGSGAAGATAASILAVAGAGTANGTIATYASGTWTTKALDSAVADPSVAATPNGALIVARGTGDSVVGALYTEGSPAAFAAAGGGVALDGPTLITYGAGTGFAAFIDTSNALKATAWNGQTWATQTTIGVDAPAAIGAAAPAIGRFGTTIDAFYPGSDGGMYEIDDVLGTPTKSAGVMGVGTKAFRPALVADAAGNPVIFFVRGGQMNDAAVCVTVKKSGTWTAPIQVANLAATDTPLSAALLANGDLIVVWKGYDPTAKGLGGVFAARGTDGDAGWGSGFTVFPTPTDTSPTSPPLVMPGVGGHDADVLFVHGGVAQMFTVDGIVATPDSTFGTGLADIGAAALGTAQ